MVLSVGNLLLFHKYHPHITNNNNNDHLSNNYDDIQHYHSQITFDI